MNIMHRLVWRRGTIAASAASVLLSSAAFSASPVSPPPRPNAGKQIVVPGESPEQLRQNSRAHSNKLRNKVQVERDETASIDNAAAVNPLSSTAISLPKTAALTDAADVHIGK